MKMIKKSSVLLLLAQSLLIVAQPSSELFQLLSPDYNNIHFQNTITDEKEHNILLYSNYYGGAGVGVGDFNKDGRMDIFFAGNLVKDELYLNQGDMRFQNASVQAGLLDDGGWSSGVIVADVNNDGWPDIYLTRELYDEKPELRRNLLYINKGWDGTESNGIKTIRFEEQAAAYGIDNAERTRHALFFDYDLDGWLDLFLLNQPPNPGNYSAFMGTELLQEKWAPRLLRNTGQGRFEDVSKTAGVLKPGYPNSAVSGDFNKDGWPDLYISNDYEVADFLYLNNGDGSFTDVLAEQTNHISFYAMGVDAADINNDRWLDIMTLDMVAEDNFRLKSNMSGMNPEAFWKIVDQGDHYQYMFNALHLNNQGQNYSDIAQMAGISNTDWSWANLIADFDNDGWKDVYVTNGLLRDIRNTDAARTFPNYVREVIDDFIKANPNAGEVSIFDILNLEEALDLLPSVPLKNYMYQNQGALHFQKQTEEWGLDQETFSNGAAYADFDNDGDLDLVVNNINEVAYLYQNTADTRSANWLRVELTDQQAHRPLFGAQITVEYGSEEQQFIELTNVRGMYSTSEQMAHFGLGKHPTVSRLLIELPDGRRYEQRDLKANQLYRIDVSELAASPTRKAPQRATLFQPAAAVQGLRIKHEENDFDDYEKQVLLPHKMSQFGPALAVGDWNGDGLEDVFVGGAAGQAGQLLLQQSDARFTPLSTAILNSDASYEDIDAVFLDVEQDGDLDLYVVSGGNAHPPQNQWYQDRLYINTGGQLERGELPVFRESGAAVRPYDYDGDGDLDLLIGGRHQPWSYPSPSISRLLENENGRYKDVTSAKAPGLAFVGMVTDAVWTDLDGDQDIDFVLVGEWMPITFFENTGQAFEKREDYFPNSTGWWYSIEAADMDGDQDIDLVAGNLGLNYKYKASADEPFEVHYHDFDNNGSKDIVLSYYNFGEQYPLRGRSCSSEQVPTLKKKFPTYDIFASADMKTVYGNDQLDAALHYSAQTFASTYFSNEGQGNFKATPLPAAAQRSSINDFVVRDFNRDGHQDLLLAGNLFAAEVETPRNDAGIGLLLQGDGKGNWQSVPSDRSGINLPYDVKQIRAIPINNQFHVLFGCNNAPLKILQLQNENP